MPEKLNETHRCENCAIRRKAEEKPTLWLARLWYWHTHWCPGWKAYQKKLHLEEQ